MALNAFKCQDMKPFKCDAQKNLQCERTHACYLRESKNKNV